MFTFPVKLTTSSIGNLTRLILTLVICVTIHKYGTACAEHLDHTTIAVIVRAIVHSGKAIVTGRGSSPTRTYSRLEATAHRVYYVPGTPRLAGKRCGAGVCGFRWQTRALCTFSVRSVIVKSMGATLSPAFAYSIPLEINLVGIFKYTYLSDPQAVEDGLTKSSRQLKNVKNSLR